MCLYILLQTDACNLFQMLTVKEIDYVGYYNMKRIYDEDNELPPEGEDISTYDALQLSAHPNFEDSLVNLKESAVHVPINVYEVSEHHLSLPSITVLVCIDFRKHPTF